MNNKKILATIFLTFVVLSTIATITDRQTHFVNRFITGVIMDSRNHYLSCDQLPSVEQVDTVVKEHKEVIEQLIKAAGKRFHDTKITPLWEENMVKDGEDSYISFSWGEPYPDCQNTGKGDIQIMYPSHQDRVVIEKIINGDTFFGIPYRLKNV